MPQLIFKGIKAEDVGRLSGILPDLLSDLSDTPRDYFTFECPATTYFFDGQVFDMYPLVEVIQFSRGTEIEKAMAQLIQEQGRLLGYPECEVYFTHVVRENYYE